MKPSLRLFGALALMAATFAPRGTASAQDTTSTTPTTDAAAGSTTGSEATAVESVPEPVPAPAPAPVAAPAVTQNTERVNETAPSEDMTDWTVGAGGSMNAGNTQNYTLNMGSSFAIVRGSHGLALNGQFNIGAADLTPQKSAPPNTTPHLERNSQNFLGRARYDFFMTRLDAMFVGLQYRWDPFAGLDFRQQYQVGYQRNFVRTDKHRLWAEIGYDYTHDNTTTAVDNVGCSGDTCNYHSVRAFLGYDNRLNSHVNLLSGFELLENLQQASHVRFNWQTNLTTRVAERLAIETKFRWLYDSRPAGSTKYRNDAQLVLALVFDLM